MSRVSREDLRVPDAEADIYLVGLGIGGFERRTVEADDILRHSAVILHLTAFHSELCDLSSGIVVNLNAEYTSSDHPEIAYSAIESTVLSYFESHRFLGPIALVFYGHPLFLVDNSWNLISRLSKPDTRVKAIPGTTFVDTTLSDLGTRFDVGYQFYEATHFFHMEPKIDDRHALILAQIGEFGSESLRSRGNLLTRLDPLFQRVAEIYPPGRSCALYMSSWRSDMAPKVTWAKVSSISTLVSRVHVGVSLFVSGAYEW